MSNSFAKNSVPSRSILPRVQRPSQQESDSLGVLGNLLTNIQKLQDVDVAETTSSKREMGRKIKNDWNLFIASLQSRDESRKTLSPKIIQLKIISPANVDESNLQSKLALEEKEKWRKKAEERRVQFKKGALAYNKGMLPQLLTTGPNGPGFAAERGKPVRP
mmetsp:Transcript_8019/g.10701  ORF Transcript_8019/g.10701 Transcript_8019/m.10701 type:complete len:162 (-) Transcript_8019:144-629(-)